MANYIDFDANNAASNHEENYLLGIEDKVFPTTFLILKIAGVWLPTTIKSRSLCLSYRIYSLFCATSVAMVMVSVVMHSVLSDDNSLELMMQCWYMLVIWSNALVKTINLLCRRAKILHMFKSIILEERWSVARNEEETAIFKESEQAEKYVTQLWFSMILINAVSSALKPFIHENPNNALMFDCYSPCDRSITPCFWTAYAYQLCGYWVSSIVHVGCDCLIFNFIERISTHLKILVNRLQKLPARAADQARSHGVDALECESAVLKECIRDHHSIYRTVQALNDTFYEMVCIQFVSTISILCTNIYFLSKQELFSPDFVAVSAFLCCAMTQNFFFCWYGYKLSQSSADVAGAIFDMDWFLLGKQTRKMLCFMMMSASKGIVLFNNAVVNLSPETFLKLVKGSYSAFNLLQQSN